MSGQDAVELTRKLLQFNTINPPGQERDCARHAAALLPLVRGSTDAIAHSGLARAMAGTVARGDAATLSRHLDALGRLGDEPRDFYRRLALRTIPLALAAGSLDAARANQLRKLLEVTVY